MTRAVTHISSRAVQVIIGVDTHKDQHVAVAIDGLGCPTWREARVRTTTSRVRGARTVVVQAWDEIHAFGIEGTGSYGAGLARFLTDRGTIQSSRSTGLIALSAIARGRVIPPTRRWQRAQYLPECRRRDSKVWRGRSRDDPHAQERQELGRKGSYSGCQPDEGTGCHSSR